MVPAYYYDIKQAVSCLENYLIDPRLAIQFPQIHCLFIEVSRSKYRTPKFPKLVPICRHRHEYGSIGNWHAFECKVCSKHLRSWDLLCISFNEDSGDQIISVNGKARNKPPCVACGNRLLRMQLEHSKNWQILQGRSYLAQWQLSDCQAWRLVTLRWSSMT